MKKKIAKVVPQPRGEYDPNYNYEILDTVQSGAAIYQSRKDGNLGHPVSDREWWRVFYDLGAAIDAATNANMSPTDAPSTIKRIMAIGEDGSPHSIDPKALVKYVIEHLISEYDFIAVEKHSI